MIPTILYHYEVVRPDSEVMPGWRALFETEEEARAWHQRLLFYVPGGVIVRKLANPIGKINEDDQ